MPVGRKRKIISLHGAAPPIPQRMPSIEAKLDELRGRAKDGQIVGFCYVAIDPYGHTIFGRAGAASADSLIAGTSRLWFDVMADDRASLTVLADC